MRSRGSNHRKRKETRQRTSAGYGSKDPAEQGTAGSSAESVKAFDFGVVVYDLEAIHDAEHGTYAAAQMFECQTPEQEEVWKARSQIIQFAAIDVGTGRSIEVSCRPEFDWGDVKSLAMRRFAMDHGLDKLVCDANLPRGFGGCWASVVRPFLREVSGQSRRLVLIAHNGDKLDHPLLQNQLARLECSDLPFEAHWFDPVRSLKAKYGPDYGRDGQLVLGKLHAASGSSQPPPPSHHALSDCRMLLEVLANWEDLRELMACEIASEILAVQSYALSAFFCKAPSLPVIQAKDPDEGGSQRPEQLHVKKIPVLAFVCRCSRELDGVLLGPSIGKSQGLDLARRFGVHVLKVVEPDEVEWRNYPKRKDAFHRGWTYYVIPGEVKGPPEEVPREPGELKGPVLDPRELLERFAPWYSVPGTAGEVRLTHRCSAFERFLETLSVQEKDLRSKCLDVFPVEMPRGAPPCWIGAPALDALLFVPVELILNFVDVSIGNLCWPFHKRARASLQGKVIFEKLCQCLHAQGGEVHRSLRVQLPDATVRELGQMRALNMRYTFGWSPAAVLKQDRAVDIPATAYTVVHELDKLLFLFPDNPLAKGKQEVPKTFLDKLRKLQSVSFLEGLQPVLPDGFSLAYR